jgi:hypothetical protein
MLRTSFIATSRRIEIEKTVKRLGTASVRFNMLEFPYSKKLDLTNVERLKRLFISLGSYILDDLLHHILAIISGSEFRKVLTFSRISRD